MPMTFAALSLPRLVRSTVIAIAVLSVQVVGCGARTYDEHTYAGAASRLDEWIARADEPLKSELAARKAEFDRRMITLPTEAGPRSDAIRAVFDEAVQTSSTYEARILDDLRSRARPALAASGLVGFWSGSGYRLSIDADGRISYAREGGTTYVRGEILRVDPSGLVLTVWNPGAADRTFDIEHAPRMEGTLRVIHVNGRQLRFWQ